MMNRTTLLLILAGLALLAFVIAMGTGLITWTTLRAFAEIPPEDDNLLPPLRARRNWTTRYVPPVVVRYVKLTRNFIPLLPKVSDGPIALVTKGIAALSYLEQETQADPWGECVAWLNEHVPNENAHLNDLCYDLITAGPLADQFTRSEVTKYIPTKPCYLVVFQHKTTRSRIWVSMKKEQCQGVWFEEGFGFDQLLGNLWAQYGSAIHVDFSKNSGKKERQLSAIPTNDAPLFGSNGLTTKRWADRLRRCRTDKVPRAYLLVGPPGTGKSTAVANVCQDLGLRLLRVSPSASSTVTLRMLVETMRPDILLLDDYDRALPRGHELSDALAWLTDVRANGVIVVMTANSVTKMPEALVRPGRIDEVLWFGEPCLDARYEVLKGYADHWKLLKDLPEEEREVQLHTLADGTEGDTEATLRYVAEQLRYDTPADILEILNVRRTVLGRTPLKGRSKGKSKDEDDKDGEDE
jgi:ATPase family associated with various cellular activities (AAA)